MSEGPADQKPKPAENPSAFLLGMIGTLYKNPTGYALTVGELDALLWQIHFLWSAIAGRHGNYVDVRCRMYDEEFANRVRKIRGEPISNEDARSIVTGVWRDIDASLGINTDPDQWEWPQ